MNPAFSTTLVFSFSVSELLSFPAICQFYGFTKFTKRCMFGYWKTLEVSASVQGSLLSCFPHWFSCWNCSWLIQDEPGKQVKSAIRIRNISKTHVAFKVLYAALFCFVLILLSQEQNLWCINFLSFYAVIKLCNNKRFHECIIWKCNHQITSLRLIIFLIGLLVAESGDESLNLGVVIQWLKKNGH